MYAPTSFWGIAHGTETSYIRVLGLEIIHRRFHVLGQGTETLKMCLPSPKSVFRVTVPISMVDRVYRQKSKGVLHPYLWLAILHTICVPRYTNPEKVYSIEVEQRNFVENIVTAAKFPVHRFFGFSVCTL